MTHSRVVMRAVVFSLLLAVSVAFVPGSAAADPYRGVAPQAAGPPTGRVGRIARAVGAVSIRFPGESRWSEAERNVPVTAGSALRTSGGGNAIIELGGDRMALAADTHIEVAGLDDRNLHLRLSDGRMAFAVVRLGPGRSIEIDLATGEVWLAEPGEYAIAADGHTPQIAAFAGSARLFADGAEIGIAAGEAVRLDAADPLVATIGPAAEGNFAGLSPDMAADRLRLAALHDVSPDLTGATALDRAGTWRSDSRFGWVWLPDSLPADWAPYRDGHWRCVEPWGWTWIGDHDWGFATGHYGRWARVDRAWAWVPGKFVAEPVFAPALVAFLGTPGIGVSYEGGSGPAIGWFPLAPGEAFWPAYSDDLAYIRNLNRGALADPAALGPQRDGNLPVQVVGRTFANRLAASVVPRPVFVSGARVTPALLHLPPQRLAEMPLVMGSPRIGRPRPPAHSLPVAAAAPVSPAAKGSAKNTAWAKAVAVAAARSQRYQNTARAVHRRIAAPAAPSRPSRPPVTKADHAQPAKPSTGTRKKVVER